MKKILLIGFMMLAFIRCEKDHDHDHDHNERTLL